MGNVTCLSAGISPCNQALQSKLLPVLSDCPAMAWCRCPVSRPLHRRGQLRPNCKRVSIDAFSIPASATDLSSQTLHTIGGEQCSWLTLAERDCFIIYGGSRISRS